ncbi:SusC/RagA family TonB-linked outer membrane protein [Gelidibacter japonicus]|uniref:SusC/RagA family TonB-linked outer membrane protein n=1 Tax=Gelidibacter japonicus TaxID=1962232 RepID=UPI002AFFF66D|nr:SusC/RagA family TonB-linked outer membrane protein [Gelidibacter japonicus]
MSQNEIKIIVKRSLLLLVFFFCSASIFSQKLQEPTAGYELRGVVTESNGMPLSGAEIKIQGKPDVVTTDVDGVFTVEVSPSDVLVCSYKDYKTEKVLLTEKTKALTIVMQPLFEEDRGVDVAYGNYRKRILPGALSYIDAVVIEKNAVSSVEQALNGTLSGLHSVKSGGQKMGDSNYKFYIRGIATTGSTSPLILVDGVDANINLLDPKEIESVTVLKDATELAMFGMRGANGVILIKTKRGEKLNSYMNVEIRTGFQQANFIADKLSAYQYATLYNEASVNDGGRPVFDTSNYLNNSDTFRYPDTNFPELFLNDNTQYMYQNLNFSTGGGNDVAQYYVLVGYMKQDGLFTAPLDYGDLNNSNDERYNFRTNIDIDLGKGYKLNLNIAAINDAKRSPWLGSDFNVNSSNSNLFNRIMTTPANAYPLVNRDGSLGGSSEYQNNMLGILQSGNRVETTRQLTAKTKFTKDLSSLLEGLSANMVYSFENYNSYYQGRYTGFAVYQLNQDDTYTMYGVDDTKVTNTGGQMGDYYKDVTITGGLDYERNFENHQVSGSLTANQYTSRISGDNPDYKWLGTSGRFLYGFQNRYFLQVSGAYQGSNSFANGQRYGFFPAAGASWVISEEAFLNANQTINYLKLRGSYGLVGNHLGATRYLHRQAYIKNNGYGFGNPNGSVPGTYAGTLGNHGATWEKSLKTNVGFDLSMFTNALTLSADYFHENRKDILVPQANVVPDLIGVGLPLYNAGNITNKGIELQLNYTKNIGELLVNVGGNTTIANNKIIDLKEVAYGTQEGYRYRKGHSVDSYFGYVANGIYTNQAEIDADAVGSSFGALAPGDIKYLDLNGDGIINDADKKAIGNTLPEVIYGLHLGLEFKGFDLYASAEGTSKFISHIIPNQFSTYVYDNRFKSEEVSSTFAYPRVSLESLHNQQTSTFWQENGNLFRLSTIELGYTLPTQVVRNLSISKLRLFLNVDNIFSTNNSIEGRDFEAVNAGYSDYPMLKTYLVGLSVNL